MSLKFEVLQTAGRARRGRLGTPHGVIETPAFMPVGTLGAVKGVTPDQLEDAGASVMLCNLYHLAVRPGIDVIERLGGLHAWNGWQRPILTDSGGFQVMSLAKLRALDEDGVTFRSHVDGAALRFSPEIVVDLQRRLGVDVAMILDECAPWPVGVEGAAAAVDRTEVWARRAREAWASRPGTGGLFGIVQGSVYPELRDRAAASIRALDFDGVAIGGVSVGEPAADRRRVVEHTAPQLPPDKPRYLMAWAPARPLAWCPARHRPLRLRAVRATRGMGCSTAAAASSGSRMRAIERTGTDRSGLRMPGVPARRPGLFLHHLIRSGEITGAVLATLHNLRFFLDFMGELRQALVSGSLDEFASDAMRRLGPEGLGEEPETVLAGRNQPST